MHFWGRAGAAEEPETENSCEWRGMVWTTKFDASLRAPIFHERPMETRFGEKVARGASSKTNAIGNQKRKWRVKFFSREGKPDNCGGREGHGGAKFCWPRIRHILSWWSQLLVGRKGESPGRLGSEKSLKTVTDALHLQSTMNQMVQYDLC